MEVKNEGQEVKQENQQTPGTSTSGNSQNPIQKKNFPNRGGKKNFNNKGNRPGGSGMNFSMRGGPKNDDFMINQKMKQIMGPLTDLPELSYEEVKFSGRNRLYVGNLTSDVTEDELRELFSPYGEIAETFINSEKNFAFLKLDYHINAEKAKKELDGTMRKNRPIRIRFAPNATIVRVKNLNPFISNELLHTGFEVFGPIERAIVNVDDRGKPTGEGIVEYARKSSAMNAVKYCQEKCYFLTSSLRPCVVEFFDHIDDNDGYPEKSMMKKNDYYEARENGPRFANLGSFEHEFGTKWKQLYDLYKQKHEALKREMVIEEEKLEAQMEYVRYEHETERLREQLKMREQDRDRQKREWEKREQMADEMRQRDDVEMRRSQESMQQRMMKQDEEMKRRQQENSLFMQAQHLNNMLDQQEMSHIGGANSGGRKNFNDNQMDNNRRNFDMMNQGNHGGGSGGNYQQNQQQQQQQHFQGNHNNQDHGNRFNEGPSQGHQQGGPSRGNMGNMRNNNPWNNDRQMGGNNGNHRVGGGNNMGDDFPNKRRRY